MHEKQMIERGGKRVCPLELLKRNASDQGLEFFLPQPLANLLCSKCTDSIEPEAKHKTILVAQTNIESVILNRDGTAVVSITESHGRTNERRTTLASSILKIEKERESAKEATPGVSYEDGWTPLRAL